MLVIWLSIMVEEYIKNSINTINLKLATEKRTTNFIWGKCYISPILDMHTNEIISYNLAKSPNLAQIRRMLKKVYNKFSNLNGLLFHSDQGWQYQHVSYRTELQKHGIIQSMSRKGNCYDNCIMETFFGRMKNEMYMGTKMNINHLKNSKNPLRNI